MITRDLLESLAAEHVTRQLNGRDAGMSPSSRVANLGVDPDALTELIEREVPAVIEGLLESPEHAESWLGGAMLQWFILGLLAGREREHDPRGSAA